METLLVTSFSDASFSLEHGKAGFSFWWKSSVASHRDDGSADCSNTCQAELLGILAAIKSAVVAHGDRRLDFVVQCDSQEALGCLITKCNAKIAKTSPTKFHAVRRIKASSQVVLDEITELTRESNLWLKHVKGHTNRSDSRHFLNRINDRFARSSMRRAVRGVSKQHE